MNSKIGEECEGGGENIRVRVFFFKKRKSNVPWLNKKIRDTNPPKLTCVAFLEMFYISPL